MRKRNEKTRWILTGTLIAASMIFLPAISWADSIRIGAILSLSGNSSANGQSVRDGILLAVDEVNKRGGVNGNRLEMIIEDSKSDPQAAVEAFKRIESTRPPLFYTSFLSNVGVALAPLADENKVVLVGLVTSALAFTRGHEMVYRYWPLAQADIGPALRILQDLKVKKLGILYSNEEYGTEEQKLLANAFEGTGGSVIRQSFELDTKDFSGQIKSLMGQDAIYTATLGSNLTTSIVQLKGAGYRGQVVMPSSGASPAFFAMPEMQGVYLIAPVIYNPRYLFAREASDRFTARYQKPFNHWSAAGYDFIKLTAGLLEDQPVSRKSLQDLLAAGFEYSGVFGHIVVRPGGHEMSFPLSAAQIVDNALKFR